MIQKFIFFIFFAFSAMLFGQKMAIGTVTSESGTPLPGIVVQNMRSDQSVYSNRDGQFAISAETGDELRITAPRYDRKILKLSSNDFSASISIVLPLAPKNIQEVEIAFKPSGILKKDVLALDQPKKLAALNAESNKWMRQTPNEFPRENKTPSTLITGPNYSAGQINVLGIAGKILGYAINKIDPPPAPKNFAEKEAFFKKVKSVVDLNYFYAYGMDEFGFESFLIYADKKLNLAQNYSRNFNKTEIEDALKGLVKKYMETYKG